MVRLALIGTGRMANIHFQSILNHPIATCNYVVSNKLSRAQEFIDYYGNPSSIHASSDLKSVLQHNSDDIDGVVVTSASNQHYEQIKQCLEYNKPVFVEKPIADSLNEIDELYTLAQQKNLPPISVGYQRRFDPNIQMVYKQIYENNVLMPPDSVKDLKASIGGIEKIISISKDPTYPQVDYMTDSINGFYDSMIHDIDTICYLSKQFPNKVYCAGHAHYGPIQKLNDFDRIFITFEFESGLLGMVDWCRHSGFSYDQRLNILGYNGMLEIGNERDNLCVMHNNNGAQIARPKDYFLERYSMAYNNEIEEFIQVIQGNKSVNTTHEQVRNVHIIVAATEQSARSGQPVIIDYNQGLKEAKI